jgi:glucan-binding YG repeat protein
MVTNQWIGDYYVDSNGLWSPDHWINNGGKWWYRHQDGSYTKNDFEDINGQTYYFDRDGYMVTGWRHIKSDWYLFNGSGMMVKDQWSGNYYLEKDGKMAKSKWVGTTYFDGNGIVQPDRWIYNGRWWYRYGDGSYPRNKFDVINNNVYYFRLNRYIGD